MRAIATDVPTQRCLSVCLRVGHDREPIQEKQFGGGLAWAQGTMY